CDMNKDFRYISVMFLYSWQLPRWYTLFPTRRSSDLGHGRVAELLLVVLVRLVAGLVLHGLDDRQTVQLGQDVVLLLLGGRTLGRSEEHTSELQSQSNLVCRLLLEKK